MEIVLIIILAFASVVNSKLSQPHILFVLVDDLGWSDVGFHGSKIKTPNIDRLAREGVVLDNYYVQAKCTPSRAALLSGRYPIHIGLQHRNIHPDTPYGLPLNVTTFPRKLKEVGYNTHMIGKWHLGFYNWESTPTERGFDTFYGLYNGAGDHYRHTRGDYLDFRDNKEIVRHLNGTYSAKAFTKRALQIVSSHNGSHPLFLYMAFQTVHGPVQAPKEHVDKYMFINDTLRQTYAGMVDIMDEAVENITNAFKEAGLWNNTVLIFSSDNGGVPKNGGYNYPLRGLKSTLWEGGIRAVGFVHSKLLSQRGVKCKGLIHVTDWYPTLVNLADGSVDEEDLDGHDVWKTVSAGEPSPRTEILHNIDIYKPDDGKKNVGLLYQGIGLRVGDFKLLMKVPNISYIVPPEETNCTQTSFPNFKKIVLPRVDVALYNITADPYEKHDLSETFLDVVGELKERVQYYMNGTVPPGNKPPDPKAREVAKEKGAWSPWM